MRHAEGRSGHLCMGGTLAFAWLVACAIGLAIYFLPIALARLLDSLTE